MSRSVSKVNSGRIIQQFTDLYFINEGDIYCKLTGKIKGCLDKSTGYKKFRFLGKYWYQHRLIYLVTHGSLPNSGLDHINGVRSDNRPENLRPALQKYNAINRIVHKNNKSGYKGVTRARESFSWASTASGKGGKRVRLGSFSCAKEAALAYNYHTLKRYGSKFPVFNQVFEDHENTINKMESN